MRVLFALDKILTFSESSLFFLVISLKICTLDFSLANCLFNSKSSFFSGHWNVPSIYFRITIKYLHPSRNIMRICFFDLEQKANTELSMKSSVFITKAFGASASTPHRKSCVPYLIKIRLSDKLLIILFFTLTPLGLY